MSNEEVIEYVNRELEATNEDSDLDEVDFDLI